MPIFFENPKSFARGTGGAVLGAALLAGLSAGFSASSSLPWVCACAIWGTFLGTAALAPTRKGRFRQVALGIFLGGSAAAWVQVAAEKWGGAPSGLMVGTALGGLAWTAWRMAERDDETARAAPAGARVLGAFGGILSAVLGVVGADAWLNFAHAKRWDDALAQMSVAGVFGLWLSAGAGLGHLRRSSHPIVQQAKALLARLQPPVADHVTQALAHFEALASPKAKGHPGSSEAKHETEHLAQSLFETLLRSAATWQGLHNALQTPALQAVDEKLARLKKAKEESEDSVALADLTRAAQAVRAQRHGLQRMEMQKARAQANVEAQLALLERLHVAWLQLQLGETQHFTLERDAVVAQIERVSDELDSLSSALEEAEAYLDRDALAAVEQAGRKALDRMRAQVEGPVPALLREEDARQPRS